MIILKIAALCILGVGALMTLLTTELGPDVVLLLIASLS